MWGVLEMSSRTVARGVGALLVGGTLVLTGCDSSGNNDLDEASSSAPSVPVVADVPSGYDPCTDVPQAVLDSENLKMPREQNSTVSGGIKWRGCMWVQSDGYTATIQTTNITVDMVLGKNIPDTRELEVDGRRAVSSRRVEDHPEAACTLNVEMTGGSLEFNLSNPASRKKTGHLDTCELTIDLAEKVVPTLPSGV